MVTPIGEITFPEKGLQLLTFFFDAPEVADKLPGNNFAYFEFFLEKEIKDAPRQRLHQPHLLTRLP